jgi:hypothetical protein
VKELTPAASQIFRGTLRLPDRFGARPEAASALQRTNASIGEVHCRVGTSGARARAVSPRNPRCRRDRFGNGPRPRPPSDGFWCGETTLGESTWWRIPPHLPPPARRQAPCRPGTFAGPPMLRPWPEERPPCDGFSCGEFTLGESTCWRLPRATCVGGVSCRNGRRAAERFGSGPRARPSAKGKMPRSENVHCRVGHLGNCCRDRPRRLRRLWSGRQAQDF